MQPGLTKVVTFPPGGGYGIALDMIGHVSPARYSFTTPGGCDQLSCILYHPARRRSEALNGGRTVLAYRGGSVAWAGVLDEPSPSDAGWQITAHGMGGIGADYRARWTGSWAGTVADTCVNNAISDGLPWVNPGIGSPSGLWLGQAVDSAAQDITELLNLITSKGGLTWSVVTGPDGINVLSVYALPTVANRLLVVNAPVAQSVAAGPDKIYIRYQATADAGKKPATYGLTSVAQQQVIDAQGMRQDWMDLSSAGVTTAVAAQGVGNSVLKRFTRAGFTDAFTARFGQLLNLGGTAADPGLFWGDGMTAMVVRVLLADFAFSGEVARGPITLMIGAYEWDDGAMTATLTPFESMRHDFASLMSAAVDSFHPRQQPTHKKKKGR